MIRFENDLNLVFEYSSIAGINWVLEKIKDEDFSYKGFSFESKDILFQTEDTIKFLLGRKIGEFYYIDSKKISCNFSLKIHESIKLDSSKIIVGKYHNIFQIIDNVIAGYSEITIGGSNADISKEDFIKLLKSFPTTTEKNLYYYKKVQLIIQNYFENLKNYEEKYNNYIKKKNKNKLITDISDIEELELIKYESILKILKKNIDISDQISEEEWKQFIAQIILLLFPKYINFHREVEIKIKNNDRDKKKEFLDYMLVKSNGSVDILEVKKPDCKSIISSSHDHKNYYATNTLSKVIMQTEKYIYNLNRNIEDSEERFDKKYGDEYSDGFRFRIINPKAMIIVGSEKGYNKKQINDLEIIRRMYNNIIEILTYDDLINMLERQIDLINLRSK